MAKYASRPTRWMQACDAARTALADVEAAKDALDSAFSDLRDLQSEYEDWQSNLPENLGQSALGEKLEAVVGLDLEPELDISEIESALDEAEGADLPLGFGKD